MDNNITPVNICILEYEQDNSTLKAKSSSVTTIDDAITLALDSFEKIQIEKSLNLKLRIIYSEWQPSPELEKTIKSKYPNAALLYEFRKGDEERYKRYLLRVNKDKSVNKWWQFWK